MPVRARNVDDALYGFFKPFFDTKTGHIFTLSEPKEHMRDGLAAAQVARTFPIPEFRDVLIEPGRPSIKPARNIILVGWSKLFVEPRKTASGKRLLTARLRERVERIMKECCYEFRRGRQVAMVNRVSGATYFPEEKGSKGVEVDYGVIRRLFRSPTENTVILEGLHPLGTMGAAQVITDRDLLSAIWEARRKLGDVKDRLPFEILVRAVFQPDLSDGVYAFEAIEATPLYVVFNRRWIYDLSADCEWRDQRPWDVTLQLKGNAPAVRVGQRYRAPVPRLEVQMDLTDLHQSSRALCQSLLVNADPVVLSTPAGARATRRQAEGLLHTLTSHADRFRLTLMETSERGGTVEEIPLPQGTSRVRQWRKRFIVHLILCRLLGTCFRNNEETIRRVFPEMVEKARQRDPTRVFPNRITGKIREGFGPLFGEARKPTGYAGIENNPRERMYELRLDQIVVVVRIRV